MCVLKISLNPLFTNIFLNPNCSNSTLSIRHFIGFYMVRVNRIFSTALKVEGVGPSMACPAKHTNAKVSWKSSTKSYSLLKNCTKCILKILYQNWIPNYNNIQIRKFTWLTERWKGTTVKSNLSSLEISTPIDGGAVTFDLITGAKFRSISFSAVKLTFT